MHDMKLCTTNLAIPVYIYTAVVYNADMYFLYRKAMKTLKTFQERASYFLLLWSLLASLIMKDLTLSNAASYGTIITLTKVYSHYVINFKNDFEIAALIVADYNRR